MHENDDTRSPHTIWALQSVTDGSAMNLNVSRNIKTLQDVRSSKNLFKSKHMPTWLTTRSIIMFQKLIMNRPYLL